MTHRIWGLSAVALITAGVLAGCGSTAHPVAKGKTPSQGQTTPTTKPHVTYATPQVKMSLAQIVHKYTTGIYKGLPGGLTPKWGPPGPLKGAPENIAALYQYATTPSANGGGDFPDLTANAPGAPKVPPFSLAPYPKNGAILWSKTIYQYDLKSWALQGATVAAKWMMAYSGNDPLTAWQYLNPDEPVLHGAAYKKGITSNGAGFVMEIAQAGYTGGDSYAYDTWATIVGIGDAAEWTHIGFHTPLSAMIGPGQKVLHAEEVTVEDGQIDAANNAKVGLYGYSKGGPTDILVADIQGLGWRVLESGSIPSRLVKVPAIDAARYTVIKEAGAHA